MTEPNPTTQTSTQHTTLCTQDDDNTYFSTSLLQNQAPLATVTTVTEPDINQDVELGLPGSDDRGLSWRNIVLTATQVEHKNVNSEDAGEGTTKRILHGVSGIAERGHLTCIMGASGAGKTSLLRILSGRLQKSKNKLQLEGTILLDGKQVNPKALASTFGGNQKNLGYVPQRDTLVKTLTPREALRFSAKLRLSQGTTDEEIDALVQSTLEELRLTKVADTYGSSLSGGEMRRLSLGVELVCRPRVLLLDEVTSGLDSHSAAVVMEICRHIARHQKMAVLMTIHQPNSEVYQLMDRVIVMHQGRFLYQGDAPNLMQYFADRGFPAPVGYNAPDWAIKVSQTNDLQLLTDHGFFTDTTIQNNTNKTNTKPLLESTDSISSSSDDHSDNDNSNHNSQQLAFQRVSQWTEFREIMARDFCNLARDHEALKLRVLTVVVISALLAICFWNIGDKSLQNPSTFSYHVGAVFLLATATFVALLMIITDSIEQRAIFVREYSAGYYRALPNAATKIILDVVVLAVFVLTILVISYWSLGLQGNFAIWFAALFLGSMVSNALGHFLVTLPDNPQLVMDLVPLVFAPQTLFCGFIIAVGALPRWIQWYSWLQPLTYLYRVLLHEEFAECLQNNNAGFCNTYLQAQNADGQRNNTAYWCALLAMWCFYRVLSVLSLKQKGTL